MIHQEMSADLRKNRNVRQGWRMFPSGQFALRANCRSKSAKNAGFAAAVWEIAFLTLVFGFALAGCDNSGDDDKSPANVTPSKAVSIASGKISSSKPSHSIRASASRVSASRAVGMYRAETAEPEDDLFVLETVPGQYTTDGMQILEGEVQFGDYLIELEGILDENSGRFVAAGVDSEELGVGYQIEGVYKNGQLTDVSVIVKDENMDTGEWEEEKVTPDTSVDPVITATETTDQEEGLPKSMTGKYRFFVGPNLWAEEIDYYVDFLYYGETQELHGQAKLTGTNGITLGAAVCEAIGSGDLFVLVAPMAWSLVADYTRMDSKLTQALKNKGFSDSDTSKGLTMVKRALNYWLQSYYSSFVEVWVEGGNYYAVSITKYHDHDGNYIGDSYNKYKITVEPSMGTDWIHLDMPVDLPYPTTAENVRNATCVDGGWIFPLYTYVADWDTMPALIGKVTITSSTGSMTVGSTLTATVSGSNLTVTPTYKYEWIRTSDSYPTIGTNPTYTLTAEDVGNRIMVTVSLDGYYGNLSQNALNNTPVIAAASQ